MSVEAKLLHESKKVGSLLVMLIIGERLIDTTNCVVLATKRPKEYVYVKYYVGLKYSFHTYRE